VHRLITGQKLDRFYDLRRGSSAPVRAVVFQPRDYRWLDGLVRMAEVEAAKAGTEETRLELDLQGVSCVGCVWLIEKLFRDHPGGRSVLVNATLGRMAVSWTRGGCDVTGFARELQRFGYLVGPASKQVKRESGGLILRLGLCAAFAMNAMLFSLPPYLGMEADFPFARLFVFLSFLFASASVAVGGTYFFGRSWKALRRGVVHIDLPISLGLIVAYAGSIFAWSQRAEGFLYFDFVATFTFLMLVGRWTQLAAVERNRNRLLGLNQDLPPVDLIDDDAEDSGASGHRAVTSKPASALVSGDRFTIGPGQVVPVAASLLGPGAASVGMDWISGESEARAVAPGQLVESGAINLGGQAIRLEAMENWGTSLLARLFAVKPPSEWRNRTMERIIRTYLTLVLFVAVVGGVAWQWTTGDITVTLQVVVSVLVVSCPCAIGVTLPLIDELAVARSRHAGVFVRSDDLWGRLQRVRKVIFDKTGTLTLESLVLRDPKVLAGLAPAARSALGVLVETSRHPVAVCLREALMASGRVGRDDRRAVRPAVSEVIGQGLEWTDEAGLRWRLGRPAWAGTAVGSERVDTVLGCDGVTIAGFRTGEEVRDDAVEAVERLKRRGLDVFILSGDRREKVSAMATRLGLPAEAAQAEMTPEGKAEWVKEMDRGDTLMIGDGANDVMAFAAAACRGTPAIDRGLLEHRSDFYFLGRGIGGIVKLIDAAAARRRATIEVIAFAISYNAIVVGVSLAGWMSPLLAAILMPASALVTLAMAAWRMRRV
jgi:Cu2+-exporting ATPase